MAPRSLRGPRGSARLLPRLPGARADAALGTAWQEDPVQPSLASVPSHVHGGGVVLVCFSLFLRKLSLPLLSSRNQTRWGLRVPPLRGLQGTRSHGAERPRTPGPEAGPRRTRALTCDVWRTRRRCPPGGTPPTGRACAWPSRWHASTPPAEAKGHQPRGFWDGGQPPPARLPGPRLQGGVRERGARTRPCDII